MTIWSFSKETHDEEVEEGADTSKSMTEVGDNGGGEEGTVDTGIGVVVDTVSFLLFSRDFRCFFNCLLRRDVFEL